MKRSKPMTAQEVEIGMTRARLKHAQLWGHLHACCAPYSVTSDAKLRNEQIATDYAAMAEGCREKLKELGA